MRARAVTYTGPGGEEVISIAERVVRAPKSGEVRVKVAAAAVSPTDVLLRKTGGPAPFRPVTPGMDLAGTVESVGPDVTRLAVGDEVMAAVLPVREDGGGQASYVVVPAASVVARPKTASLVEASTLPMNGLTALYALEIAGLKPGQVFAVSGGAGYMAGFAIAFAKEQGLRVIADAKIEEMDKVAGLGADVVVPRGSDFAGAVLKEFPEGVDALLDTALLGESSFPAIRDGGVYIPVRGWSDPESEARIRIKPVMVPDVFERTEWLEKLADAVDKGVIAPGVYGEFSPERVAEAQRLTMAGGMRGRAVIVF
ncbi:hypothetical protein TM49_20450 [Martelella endophytica]|uniref:Enoyl reductase (ER) domain-containing protein n=1 Tax=Martelella endophytica TaxID=1486262 RepID=A0A0D5LX82_MAREN|nr:hypothetical protein TM49_20450 [Martelella endophytica]